MPDTAVKPADGSEYHYVDETPDGELQTRCGAPLPGDDLRHHVVGVSELADAPSDACSDCQALE